jgi:hypothetical protein
VHLVFLSLTLCLTDAIAGNGGGDLRIRTGARDNRVRVEFRTSCPTPVLPELNENPSETGLTEASIRLAFTRDIIQAMDGEMTVSCEGGARTVTVELPAGRSDSALGD